MHLRNILISLWLSTFLEKYRFLLWDDEPECLSFEQWKVSTVREMHRYVLSGTKWVGAVFFGRPKFERILRRIEAQ